MKRVFFVILILTSLSSFAQRKRRVTDPDVLHKLGVKAYESKDFLLADSLFTLSLEIDPDANTYFSLAVTKHKLGDTCGYCYNMLNAFNYGDKEAVKFYFLNCYTSKKKLYNENINYYSVIRTQKCNEFREHRFYINEDNDIKYSFYIVDSLDNFVTREFESFPIIDSVLDQIVFVITDENSDYIGGKNQLSNFLAKNTVYPDDAKTNRIQGLVYVSFIVEKDGSLSNVKIFRERHPNLDNEALRVVSLMKNWTPGKYNNKAVRTWHVLPFAFRLH